MKILNIKINKIFSIGEINLSLNNLGLILINGHSKDEGSANGSGKSSLVRNSLLWGLFGKTLNGSQGDDVVNIHTDGKNAFVEIIFEGVDQKQYKIKRSRNPQKVELWSIDGSRLTPKISTQEMIDALLGRDYKTFIQTDFFGQGRQESFMEMSPSSQREIIENILQFENLNEWESRSKILLDFSKKEFIEQEKIIERYRGKLDSENLTDLIKKEQEWNTNFALQQIEAKEELKNLKLEIEKFQEELKKIKQDPIKIAAFIEEKSERTYKIKSIFENLEKLKNLGSQCPTCFQPVEQERLLKFKENLLLLKEANEKELIKFNSEYSKIVYSETEALKLQSKIKDYNYKIQEKIKYIETNFSNPYTSLREKIEKEKENFQNKLKELEGNLVNLQLEEKNLEFWVESYGKKMKIFFLEKACPFLENRTNFYLNLLNNNQISITFSTTKELKSGKLKEDLTVSASSKTGGHNFFVLSGGEQQMVNFAIGMALSDLAEQHTSGSSQIMVLDEPFTNLDSRNCENVVNFITQYLQTKKSTILFVSNEEGLQDLIPQRIYIEKENGISHLRS